MDLQVVELPVCRHRVAMPGRNLCKSPAVHSSNGVDDRTCLTCAIRDHGPATLRERKPSVRHGTLRKANGEQRKRETRKPSRMDCAHMGEPVGTAGCQTCAGRIELKVFGCDKFGSCTVAKQSSDAKVKCCATCDSYAPKEAKIAAPVDWPDAQLIHVVPGIIDPMPYPEMAKLPAGWANNAEVMDRHIQALRRMLTLDFPPPDKADGDGVVYCGGGKYWPMVVVAVKMLREVSNLPVQIWHRGASEPVKVADLDGVPDVQVIDATTFSSRILRGWETKSVALMNCGLRRVLYLDADAYAVADPSPLLDMASQGRFVYWIDLPNCEGNVKWGGYGMPAESAKIVPRIQGGQLAIDLVQFRREMVLAHWLNQHSEYFYRHSFGDQDQWRVALAATEGSFSCLGAAPWRHPAFVCELDGKPLIVHRCRGKIGIGNDKMASHLPKEDRVFRYLGEQQGWKYDAASVFGRVYASGQWGGGGSSGSGSRGREASAYLGIINNLISERDWKRVVDLGCGDGAVASKIAAETVIGVDCHAPHINRLQKDNPNREWLCLDLDTDREKLPSGDVWLLKDVAHHWNSDLIVNFLKWAISSGKADYLVLTNDRVQQSDDCPLGGYRGLDPSKEPLASISGLETVTNYLHKSVLILDCRAARSFVIADPT